MKYNNKPVSILCLLGILAWGLFSCEGELASGTPAPDLRQQMRGDWVITSITGKYFVGTAPNQRDTTVSFPVSDRVSEGQGLPDTLSLRTEGEIDSFYINNRSELLASSRRVNNRGRWFVSNISDPNDSWNGVGILRLGRFVPAAGTTAARWVYGINANTTPNNSVNNNIVYTIKSLSGNQLVCSYTLTSQSVPIGEINLAGAQVTANRDVLYTVTFTRQ